MCIRDRLSAVRALATTSWPPRTRRSAMKPPIFPRPINPSCMSVSLDARGDLFDLLEHAAGQVQPHHAAAVVGQRCEITRGLRRLQHAERVVLPGYPEVLLPVAGDLEEYPIARAAFVKLAGGMKKPRSEPERRGRAASV